MEITFSMRTNFFITTGGEAGIYIFYLKTDKNKIP